MVHRPDGGTFVPLETRQLQTSLSTRCPDDDDCPICSGKIPKSQYKGANPNQVIPHVVASHKHLNLDLTEAET